MLPSVQPLILLSNRFEIEEAHKSDGPGLVSVEEQTAAQLFLVEALE